MARQITVGLAFALYLCACSSPEAPPPETPREVPPRKIERARKPSPDSRAKQSVKSMNILDGRGPFRICTLHDEDLLEDVVLIVGGLPWPDGPVSREAQLYPHANTEFWARSCVAGPELCAKVLYCPECRRRKAAILEELRKGSGR